jgi:hypothetical protein
MLIIKRLAQFSVFILLTFFTQIGGVIWLFCRPISIFIRKKTANFPQFRKLDWLIFPFIYLISTWTIVPFLAEKTSGRVSMPMFENAHLKPQSWLFCLLNRHYVQPELKQTIERVAESFAQKNPENVVVFLDANFPFFDGFPLFGHFSHKDGKKIDLAFCWKNKQNTRIFGNPSPIGYGARVEPNDAETSNLEACGMQMDWYKRLPERIAAPFWSPEKCIFDEEKTRELGEILVAEPRLKKILLEPFLSKRWGFDRAEKVRFQGCKAAPHDDHFHVQL